MVDRHRGAIPEVAAVHLRVAGIPVGPLDLIGLDLDRGGEGAQTQVFLTVGVRLHKHTQVDVGVVLVGVVAVRKRRQSRDRSQRLQSIVLELYQHLVIGAWVPRLPVETKAQRSLH